MEAVLWALGCAVIASVVSWAAWRRIDGIKFPQTPYEAYMHGQLVAGPVASVVFLVVLARELAG